MVHAGLEERVRDSRYPGPPLPPSWYGAEDRWPAWGGVVRHRTMLRRAAVIAALALAATSVAPVRAQTRYYVLFPAGEQPASPKNEVGFPDGSSSSTYQVRGAQSGDPITPIADSLLDAVFLDGNTKIRVTPQSVTPAAFAAVYGATGGVGGDVEVDAGVFEGASTNADLLFIVAVRYDASARFTNAQPINSQRWGTPQIEIYEGATEDPALAYAWAAHGGGTRNWATGNPASAYRCRVGGDVVTFSAWPASAGEDSTLFEARPTSTSAASGNGRLILRAAPDYENPTDSGGDNLYRVRVRNGHNLNDIFGEGTRTGCDGSALELTVRVKDAGPPAPVSSLTGSLDSDTMTIAVDWTPPAGFLDGSDSSVVVPFNTARMSGSGIPGTAVVGYDYEYRLEGSSTWTQGTTTSTSFEITGVGASDAYRVRVRARNAEGAGAFRTIDAPRQLEEPNQPPSVSASCHPCTVVPGGEVRLTATASDPDDDDLTYAWTASQGAFGGGTDAAATRWTAPEATGRVTIRVEVSDNQGGSASATVAVTVEPPNRPPSVWAPCDPCEVPRLGEVELTATASDPDGDELTYAWSAPAGTFSGAADAATARWTAPDSLGPVAIRVEVTDGYGGSASAEVTVGVKNRPPAFESSEHALELRENLDGSRQPVGLGTVAAADPDGDELTYELASGGLERVAGRTEERRVGEEGRAR
ncbi:MAG: Ig-like domain-containing protein, partial [Acidobacteria bacterium]|nr:Ig-like domain-containing protein [Acidobacteriota bacterium]